VGLFDRAVKDNGWCKNEVGRYVRLGVDDAKGWEKSLTKVKIKGVS
jgi:hypothetical protein